MKNGFDGGHHARETVLGINISWELNQTYLVAASTTTSVTLATASVTLATKAAVVALFQFI